MGQIAPKREIIEKIQQALAPTTKKQVRAFLGLTGYYREFIPRYAEIAAPLTNLTRKGQSNTVQWCSEHDTSFKELKRRLAEPPNLLAPDVSKQFVLRTDSPDEALGAVLLQEHEGMLYGSRKLSASRTRVGNW